jgi:uncharacterized protein YdeI (YjbR/CyaY-like superfamily)
MPDDIREQLEQSGRMADYRARPHYQRNDYLAWIGRAATDATRQRRIDKMLHELEIGGVYMSMEHRPSAKR